MFKIGDRIRINPYHANEVGPGLSMESTYVVTGVINTTHGEYQNIFFDDDDGEGRMRRDTHYVLVDENSKENIEAEEHVEYENTYVYEKSKNWGIF